MAWVNSLSFVFGQNRRVYDIRETNIIIIMSSVKIILIKYIWNTMW